MQVELGEELPDGLRAALEQREDPALEPLLQPPDAGTAHRDRAARQRQPPRLPESVPVHHLRAGLSPLRLPPPEEPVNLLVEQPLDEGLDLPPGELFQLIPPDA